MVTIKIVKTNRIRLIISD